MTYPEFWQKDNLEKAKHIVQMVQLELDYQGSCSGTHVQRNYDVRRMAARLDYVLQLIDSSKGGKYRDWNFENQENEA